MNRELNIFVLPGGELEAEWGLTEEPVGKTRQLFEGEAFKRFTSNLDSFFLFLAFSDKEVTLSESLGYWRFLADIFAKKLLHTPEIETLRDKVTVPLEMEDVIDLLSQAPLMTGAENINAQLIESIWQKLLKAFSSEVKSYNGAVGDFIKTYSPNIHLTGRVYFHLVENKDPDFPFAFLTTYSTGMNKDGKSKHLPLKSALKEYGKKSGKLLDLLSTVYLAAKESPLISDLLDSGEIFHPLLWESDDAFTFLKETPLYDKSGILCRIPDWWKGGRASSLKINMSVGEKNPSLLGMDAILNINSQLLLGGSPISEQEARKLLEESEGLAFIKGKWTTLDHEKLRQTLEAYDNIKGKMEDDGLTIRDALRMQLNPKEIFGTGAESDEIEFSNGQWLESVMGKLRNTQLITPVKPAKNFKANLREYQQRGLNWLCFLHHLGFGACLADDMGLGKTVQVLAFLNVLKNKKTPDIKKASLLIIPASLISNWVMEINRFSPDLKYLIAHPSGTDDKKVKERGEKELNSFDLVITTYALSQKYSWLKEHSWYYLLLDEAQAIKNPGTKQTRSVKKYSSFNRVIMTGTPVENRLSDLWSLFDFLNPGLLGNSKEFTRFTKTLKDDKRGFSKLRKVISPYILRRLKTDRSIISDLPEKVEMKTYANLTKKQVVLYKSIIDKTKMALLESSGIQRKGMVLALLLKFKQICNHPDQYLGTGDFEEGSSGKFERLREICETIYEKREKVLVFTQFREMAGPLNEFLKTIFCQAGLVLHGGVPVEKRKTLIDAFQSKEYVPYMVLSLKAGGVGLNLTEANHVVHFDRWWNPAVENQATDRAFRIGQKKNVIVHKFVTKGTIEDKIDEMIEEKSRLSADVVNSSGESWITEMDNEKLMDMFKLTL